MIWPLLLLVLGLGLAGTAAAIGVSAAAVSQADLTRWVSYKLRGAPATAQALRNPGRVLSTANVLTTLGVLVAAAAIPALLARTTPTFLGLVSVLLIVPLFVIVEKDKNGFNVVQWSAVMIVMKSHPGPAKERQVL